MIIDTTMTKKDYRNIVLALMFKRKKILWICSILLFLTLIFACILASDNDYFLIILWGVSVLFLVGFYGYLWFLMNRNINSKDNSKLYLPRRFEFKDDVVLITTPFAKEEVKWDAFVKWNFIAGQYMLYVSNNTFVAIKDVDVKDKEGFESMLKVKVKKA